MVLSLDQEEITFEAKDGLKCRAWLYAPQDRPTEGAPVVVMAHGFGAHKNFKLDAFAKYFAENGIAAFAFDYRHWGTSEGTPRNILNISKQQQDYFSALDYVYNDLNDEMKTRYPHFETAVVDPERIAIWGSSFSGGHVFAVAQKYKNKERIKAVVSQVPFSDGFSSTLNLIKRQGIMWALWVTVQGLIDKFRGIFGMKRHFVNIIYPKDQKGSNPRAVLVTDECVEYHDIIPDGEEYDNKVNAAVTLEMMFYRPVSYAKQVKVPVLGLYAMKDTLCPPNDVKRLLKGIPGEKEIHELPGGHFDAYGKDFDQVAEIELNFLQNKI